MRGGTGRVVGCGFALGLIVALGQVAIAGHPAAPHFSAPKPPQMHFSAPKMPQMHFAPPRMVMPKPPTSMAHMTTHSLPSGNPFLPKPGHTTIRPVKPAHVRTPSTTQNTATAALTGTTSTTRATGTVISGRRVGRPHRFYSRYYGRRGYRRSYRPTNQVNGPMLRLQRLIADLDSLGPKRQITQTQKNMLKNDLMAVAEGAPKPTSAPVQQLANDLADAMVGRSAQMINTMELAGDLKAVMNGAHIAPADLNQAISESQTLLRVSGAKQAHVQAVLTDLKAVAASLPNNLMGQAQVR